MARLGCTLVVCLVALGSAGCLLYTDPINEAPDVSISPPAEPLRKRSPATYTATARDPNDTVETFFWGVRPTCPTSAELGALMNEGQRDAAAYTHTPEDYGPFCVWVIARDPHGATALGTLEQSIERQPPVAQLSTAVRTVPLMSEVRISAEVTDDEDQPLTYRWRVSGPAGEPVTFAPCQADQPREICFLASKPGDHRVELEIADAAGTTVNAPARVITVERDRPPCLAVTTPALDLTSLVVVPREDQPASEPEVTTFRVLQVDDDVDPRPLPAGRTSDPFPFVWSIKRPGDSSFVRSAVRVETFTLSSATFQPGDSVEVRVQYLDSEDLRGAPDRTTPPCDAGVARCQATLPGGSACVRWKTWSVRYR